MITPVTHLVGCAFRNNLLFLLVFLSTVFAMNLGTGEFMFALCLFLRHKLINNMNSVASVSRWPREGMFTCLLSLVNGNKVFVKQKKLGQMAAYYSSTCQEVGAALH